MSEVRGRRSVFFTEGNKGNEEGIVVISRRDAKAQRKGGDDLDECPRARMIRMIPLGLDDLEGKAIGAEVGSPRSEDRGRRSDVRCQFSGPLPR